MTFIDGIFYVAVLIMSVVAHEFAHAYTAYRLGDDTARLSGRLTLNPLKHLDFFGSILLPLFLVISKAGFVIGWARPVPYNPNNIKDQKRGTILISIMGIITNFTIAIIFGLLIRLMVFYGMPLYDQGGSLNHLLKISTIIVFVNIVLAIFNLIPIPPLDGSKILFSLMPYRYLYIKNFLERWGMVVLLFFIIFLCGKISPIIYLLFSLITGLS